jgi:hypothetical protein
MERWHTANACHSVTWPLKDGFFINSIFASAGLQVIMLRLESQLT